MSDKENIAVSTSTVVSENENEYEHAGDSGKTTAGLNEDRLERLREAARDLPYQPGVYIMHNREGKIIYIGKSKSLHNRVFSYFFSVHHSTKTARMVDSVWYFEYILTDTEIEALALENRLIKLHAPPLQYPSEGLQELPVYQGRSRTQIPDGDRDPIAARRQGEIFRTVFGHRRGVYHSAYGADGFRRTVM